MIEKYSFRGSENTGFYTVATNSYVIVPPGYEEAGFFGQEVVESKVGKTSLVGLFAAGNSNGVLLPRELSGIERENFEASDVEFHVVDSSFNAFGNLVLCNDSGALISEKLSDHREEIEDALGVKTRVGMIQGLNPGVSAVANSNGAVIHRDASEEDALKVKEVLGLEDVDIGTVNMGSPFIGSGAAANDKHLLTGENTTGPEIGRFDRTMF
ncbi:MAG: hypothetical protein ACLFTA_02940 [Candidatus Nanohaloarchaea archaeon]